MSERRLHIGVDGRELAGRSTGVGRYLIEILRAWADDSSFGHRVTVLLPGPVPPQLGALQPAIGAVEEPGSAGTVWEQTRLPAALARLGVDVFFAAGYTAPVRRPVPFVLALYDVSFFAHPEWFGVREGIRRRWLSRIAARRAASVITISEFSAGEIVRWVGVPRTRIRIAPPGAPRAEDLSPGREPLVLFVGSLFNRRHVPDLLHAFAQVLARVPDARLVLVGDNRTNPPIDPARIAADLGIDSRVSWRRYIDDAALADLYRRARVFAFLSDYEGFAMTPMEAIAFGAPPVLLDTPVAREVYGEAARLVPLDHARIAEAFVELLAGDETHAALLAAGRARLKAFSWARSAGIVRRALEDAAAT